MKIAVNFREQQGPFGGGNRFLRILTGALAERGHQVVDHLDDRDIDAILMLDPRRRHPAVTFTPAMILRYLWRGNSSAVVIHRINECDERKNTRHMNALLKRANYCADHTVFVGSWLTELAVWRDKPAAERSVILNGADPAVFHPRGMTPWDKRGPLRLVTHHWGGNWMKGFDIYSRLDAMLAEAGWRDRVAFTYVGNLPQGFSFKHARHVPPLDGEALADELRSHHAYVTASICEPGGNHQNEGALCGLPLLYRRSGCLPEYCDGFGISFDETDFEAGLKALIADYPRLAALMPTYPHTAAATAAAWVTLLERLVAQRAGIVARRRLWRDPLLFLRNQAAL